MCWMWICQQAMFWYYAFRHVSTYLVQCKIVCIINTTKILNLCVQINPSIIVLPIRFYNNIRPVSEAIVGALMDHADAYLWIYIFDALQDHMHSGWTQTIKASHPNRSIFQLQSHYTLQWYHIHLWGKCGLVNRPCIGTMHIDMDLCTRSYANSYTFWLDKKEHLCTQIDPSINSNCNAL